VLLRPDGAVQVGWDPRRAVLVRPPHGLTATGLAAVLRTMQTPITADALRREAAVLWERLTAAVGVDTRDTVWQHPDLLPEAADLDDPAAFIDRTLGGDTSGMDSAIDQAIADFQRETDGTAGTGGTGDADQE
jgi:hypothetical protein